MIEVLARDIKGNGKSAKICSILLIALFVTGIMSAFKSYSYTGYEQHTPRFLLENIAIASSIGMLLAWVFLISVQGELFRVLRPVTRKVSDKQLRIRLRVFEKSYKFVILIVLSLFYVAMITRDTIIPALNRPFASSVIYWTGIQLIILLSSLPPILAAWEKDR